MTLTAADFRLGKAYGLGRALAETTLVTDAKNPQTFERVFARYRLANLLSWLADLKSVFPPHAAEAVRGSLQAWAAWREAPTLGPALDDLRPASDAEVNGKLLGRPRPVPVQRPHWPVVGPSRARGYPSIPASRKRDRSTGDRQQTARA